MPVRQITPILRVVDDPEAVGPVDRIDQVDKGGQEARRAQEARQSVLMDLEVVQVAAQADLEVVRSNDAVVNKSGADVNKKSFNHKS